jgi:hypothetical protein
VGLAGAERRTQMTDEDLPLAKTEQYFVDAIVKLFKNKRAQGWSDLAILEHIKTELALAAQSVQGDRPRKIRPH